MVQLKHAVLDVCTSYLHDILSGLFLSSSDCFSHSNSAAAAEALLPTVLPCCSYSYCTTGMTFNLGLVSVV